MCPRPRRRGNLLVTTALLGTVSLAIAGCKTPDMSGSGAGAFGGTLSAASFSGSPAAPAAVPEDSADWRREAASASQRYRNNPQDAQNAIRYARALRKSGQHSQAAAVLQQASMHNPNNRPLLGEYGRALAENGQLKEAFDILGRAHTPDQPDWRVLSAQGAVLDQMGRHEDARRYYTSALAMVPNEPSVLSNLGLSYALSKELPKAEQTLRSAAATGAKDKRVRQNLALVVGLQGRFKEAEDIARADLPPAEAAENVAYLQKMIPQGAPTAVAAAKPARKPKTAVARKTTEDDDGPTGSVAAQPAARASAGRPMQLGAGG